MKASQYYKIWLKADHLPANGQVAAIEAVKPETLHPRPTQERTALTVKCKELPHRLILNEGNANRLVRLFGDNTDGWLNRQVYLKPEVYAQKATIIIYRDAQAAGLKPK